MIRYPATFLLCAWTALGSAAAQQSPNDAEIRLPDPPTDAPPSQEVAPPADSLPTTSPLPAIGTLTRNMVSTVSQTQSWDVGLRASERVPAGAIVMGASFPEPGILRMTGEEGEIALALTLPEAATLPISFRLILRSSVNDLPERSAVTVLVNGQNAGTWPLSSIGEWGQIDVPGDALRAGVNTISLNMKQQHRIFCGPEASFGVWTEIDLPRSGVTLPTAIVPLNAASFRGGLINVVQRGQLIDIRAHDDVPNDSLASVVAALRATLPGYGMVRVQSPYAPVDGTGRRIGVSLREGNGAPASVTFLRSPQGALVMQVTDGPGLTELMASTLPALPQTPDGMELVPGTVTAFKELGAPLIVRNTRYALADVPFVLPRDWMNLSSQRAMLTLDYGYAADLPKGSILLVKANDVTIVLLPLDNEGGKVQPSLPVRFPANLLRGGENALTFEMIVPGDPPTLECPVRTSDMLVVLNSSTLHVPPSPPMTFGQLGDELGGIGPLDVTFASQDPSFAKTFIGQLAMTGDAGGMASLSVLRMPQDFITLGDGLPITREQISYLFQSRTRTAAPTRSGTPQSFRLTQESLSSEAPAVVEEDGAPSYRQKWAARVWDLVLPQRETLSAWLVNRSADAVLMAPIEPVREWTLVADGSIEATELASSFDAFRVTHIAQGARVALRTPDGTWETWPPNPIPHVTGPVTFRQMFQVIGNYASWAPGYYSIILVILALLSTIPAFIYVIITRKEKA